LFPIAADTDMLGGKPATPKAPAQHPMIRPLSFPLMLGLLTALAGCQMAPPRLAPATPVDLRAELIDREGPTAPPAPEGACWAAETIPAVIETTTEQILSRPEERDADGRVIRAAQYSTVTQQRITQMRRDVWFRSPCPSDYTLEFVASLQRALKARGLYRIELTALMDPVTREAVRRYQEPLGLDSPTLSLGAARSLGLIAAAPPRP
jgi:hypothetical protein